MSKFNIKIDGSEPFNEVWLHALTFKYYYFFSQCNMPTNEEITYLDEIYNNKISEHVSFGYVTLYDQRRKVEKEGYALSCPGDRFYDMSYCSSAFQLDKFRNMIAETHIRVREFETVIVVQREYGRPPGNCLGGCVHDLYGYAKMNISYNIFRRSKNRDGNWEYFKIKDRDTMLTCMPQKSDKVHAADCTAAIIPYSPGVEEFLQSVCLFTRKATDRFEKIIKDENKLTRLVNKSNGCNALNYITHEDEDDADN